jgi:hypothetical protein
VTQSWPASGIDGLIDCILGYSVTDDGWKAVVKENSNKRFDSVKVLRQSCCQKRTVLTESIDLWRWCITLRNTGVLDCVSVALSPQVNYTDWVTATCRRNLVPTFVDRGMSRSQGGGSPTVVNLCFLDRSRYFSFNYLLIYPHKGWVDPVPDPLLLRKCGSAGNRTRDLWVSSQELWLLDQRGGPGLCLPFGILNNRNHDVLSSTELVS